MGILASTVYQASCPTCTTNHIPQLSHGCSAHVVHHHTVLLLCNGAMLWACTDTIFYVMQQHNLVVL